MQRGSIVFFWKKLNYIMDAFKSGNHGLDAPCTLHTAIHSSAGHLHNHLLNRFVVVFWIHKFCNPKPLSWWQAKKYDQYINIFSEEQRQII